MEHLNKLKEIDPEGAEAFVISALRLYAIFRRSGQLAMVNEAKALASVEYPGSDRDKEKENKTARAYLQWHDDRVAANALSLANGGEEDNGQSEIDALSEWIWKKEMEMIDEQQPN
jgi:hypothetical protein